MSRNHTSPILDYLTQRAWALELGVHEQLSSLVMRHVQGVKLSEEEVEAIVAGRDDREAERPNRVTTYTVRKGVAIIPMQGVIARYSSQVNGMSQPRGTSIEKLRAQFREALGDDQVSAIVFDVNSPGGSVDGVDGFAREVFEARTKKPVFAHANSLMASAAYWIAAQTRGITAEPGSVVGSIGVYATVADISRAAKNEGVEVHIVKAGKHKAAGAPGSHVGPEQLKTIQEMVDAHYDLFVESVANGRGMTTEKAAELADGRTHLGRQALELGLVDAIGTVDTLIASAAETAMQAFLGHAAPAATTTFGPDDNAELRSITLGDAEPAAAASPKEDMDKPTTAAAASTPAAITADDLARLRAQAHEEGVTAERQRIAKIRSYAVAGQETLVATLIEENASPFQALEALHEDLRGAQAKVLEQIRASTPAASGAEEPAPAATAVIVPNRNRRKAAELDPKQLQAQWNASSAIRHEFGGDFEAFVEFQKGAAAGMVGTCVDRDTAPNANEVTK